MLKSDYCFEDYHMTDFGSYWKNKIGSNPNLKFGKGWEEPKLEKKPTFIDANNLFKEFQDLKKENTELRNRIGKIEVELSKRYIEGIHNLILSHDVIDEIWDEEDDTL